MNSPTMTAASSTPTATEELNALAAEYQLQIEEWDTATLDENLRDKFLAYSFQLTNGTTIVLFPIGQDPAVRLQAVRDLLNHTVKAPTACPDGRDFCEGTPADHADPREHVHQGPEHSMSGVYGFDLMPFRLIQWHDEEPRMSFVGMGDWPVLDLDQVDELITDMGAHLEQLRRTRAGLARRIAAHNTAKASR